MLKVKRNDPCPCGSGKKFKVCHLGREGELLFRKKEQPDPIAGEKILSLPPVFYGRSKEIIEALHQEELREFPYRIKCVDLEAYRRLGVSGQGIPPKALKGSSALMINVHKTREADPDHIYLAITPKIQDSTLIHQLAHILDYLQGSGLQPGTYEYLSLETGIPVEQLDHSQEFGYWLETLAGRFQVRLDAEDQIVSFLYRNQMLLPADEIKRQDIGQLLGRSEKTLRFLMDHKEQINDLIQDRPGYLGKR